MKVKFLKSNNHLLKKASEKIDPNSKETKKIIQTMLKIAQVEQKGKKKPIMVGLAAPQIGILKRIILVDVKADGKGPLRPRPASPNRGKSEARKVGDLRVYINPEITWQSKKKGEWYEGCYSTGKICGIVSRSTSIKVRTFVAQPLRLTHKLVEEKWTGYVARIFQHEIDHLNGKLFMDHIKNPDHLHLVEKKEFPLYRDKEAWRNWPKKAKLSLIYSPK